jgi:hypothetical protein
MGRVQWPDWAPVTVDGETYYWTAYPSKRKVGDGPWEPVESLNVSRRPNTPGTGAAFPPGTVITEQHAIDLLKLAKAHGVDLP